MRSLVALVLVLVLMCVGCGRTTRDGPRPADGRGSDTVAATGEEGGVPAWVWWGVGIVAVAAVTFAVLLAVALDDLEFFEGTGCGSACGGGDGNDSGGGDPLPLPGS